MAKSLGDIVPAARHIGEIARLISEITLGAGALIVGAGTAGVIFFMAFFTGTQVGLEGFKGLQLIGAEAFTGFVSAFANTREITPLIAGVTLAAQVGAGSPPSSGPCGSTRRSTPSRSWPSGRSPTWSPPGSSPPWSPSPRST